MDTVFRLACPEDSKAFRRWAVSDHIEAQTCRPVVDGKRVPRGVRVELWTFALEKNESPVGRLTLFNFNSRNRSAEFGYVVDPVLRGRGMGRRMLQTAFEQFFTQRDLNKVHCQTASFNAPSVRLLEGLGLTRDGVLRTRRQSL